MFNSAVVPYLMLLVVETFSYDKSVFNQSCSQFHVSYSKVLTNLNEYANKFQPQILLRKVFVSI